MNDLVLKEVEDDEDDEEEEESEIPNVQIAKPSAGATGSPKHKKSANQAGARKGSPPKDSKSHKGSAAPGDHDEDEVNSLVARALTCTDSVELWTGNCNGRVYAAAFITHRDGSRAHA